MWVRASRVLRGSCIYRIQTPLIANTSCQQVPCSAFSISASEMWLHPWVWSWETHQLLSGLVPHTVRKRRDMTVSITLQVTHRNSLTSLYSSWTSEGGGCRMAVSSVGFLYLHLKHLRVTCTWITSVDAADKAEMKSLPSLAPGDSSCVTGELGKSILL